MQDDITMPPKEAIRWLFKWNRVLRKHDWETPVVIKGYRGMCYRLHDWFWNVGSVRAGNDNHVNQT